MTPIVGLFLVALIEVALAGVVWLRNPTRAVNRWFATFAMTLAVWGTLVGVHRSLSDPVVVLGVVRVLFAVAALVPVTFTHFAVVFPRPAVRRPRVAQMLTFLGLFMSGLSFSPWIVADVRLQNANYLQPVYGPAFWLLGAHMIVCSTWALAHLAGKLQHSTGFARAQMHYVFLGAGLTAGGAITLGLLVPLVTGTSRYGVYGPYFTLIWLGFTAHSIVRHRFMDIRVVISRTLAYAMGWGPSRRSWSVARGARRAIPGTARAPAAGAVVLGLAAAALSFGLAPCMRAWRTGICIGRPTTRGWSGRAAGRWGSSPIRPGWPRRWRTDRRGPPPGEPRDRRTAPGRDRSRLPPRDTSTRPPRGPRGDARGTRPGPRPSEGAAPSSGTMSAPASSADPGAVRQELRGWTGEVAVPVRDGQLIGIILVGPKLSGDSFFGEEVDLLETLASELAIGLKNAQLYHEIVSIKEYNERILAHMDSGVIAVREDGVVTTFNPAAERILGIEAARVVGHSLGRWTRRSGPCSGRASTAIPTPRPR